MHRRTLQHVAYGAYVVLGVAGLWAAFLINIEPGSAHAAVGFGLFVPFGIPLLLALVLGPVNSLLLWRDWRLPALAGFTALVLAVTEHLSVLGATVLLVVYGVACLGLALQWFRTRADTVG